MKPRSSQRWLAAGFIAIISNFLVVSCHARSDSSNVNLVPFCTVAGHISAYMGRVTSVETLLMHSPLRGLKLISRNCSTIMTLQFSSQVSADDIVNFRAKLTRQLRFNHKSIVRVVLHGRVVRYAKDAGGGLVFVADRIPKRITTTK